jgi:hypothetical protein
MLHFSLPWIDKAKGHGRRGVKYATVDAKRAHIQRLDV